MKLNKIFVSLFAAAALLSSCSMDTENFGAIDSGNGIQTMNDCRAFVNGIYTHMRGKTSGNYNFFADIQMHQFVGIVDNGNRGGIYSSGKLIASDTDMGNIYYNFYIQINDANYFVPKIDVMLESDGFTAEEKEELKYYKGTAKFSRAYAYWYLFDKFVNYKEADLDVPGKGLQIETQYHPSGDRSTYVGRSTIRETIKYVTDELNEAYDLILGYEENVSSVNCGPNASYISSYTVQALQARFALLCNDYKTAYDKAVAVIESGNYALCQGDDYANMWVNDEGDELLFVPFADKDSGGLSIGRNYYTNGEKNASDYIPTADVYLSYGEGDVRGECFFDLWEMVISGENYYGVPFVKFPGNPALNKTTSNSNLNKGKPFRLSELYLIAAEAAATDGAAKNEANANKYLNDLREARIEGYDRVDYSGSALLNAIKAERGKELIGEGFRLSDLRRWNEGFTRTAGWDMFASIPELAPLADIMGVIAVTSNNVSYQPNDDHFVWPIPTREMQVNPQLNGQQNPGY